MTPRPSLAHALTDASSALRREVRESLRRGVVTARTSRLMVEASWLTEAAMLSERREVRGELDRARAEAAWQRLEESEEPTLVCQAPPESRTSLVWVECEGAGGEYLAEAES